MGGRVMIGLIVWWRLVMGGYVLAGYTRSYGAGESDVYLIKTDGEGKLLWNRTYGGPNGDKGWSVRQTSDGGYVIVGSTGWVEELPYDEDDPIYMDPARRPRRFHYDVWLVKTDAEGDVLWSRTYGGAESDRGYSVQQTVDGGYIIAGYTWSFNAVYHDLYLVRTDSSGHMEWNKTYGGNGRDEGESVIQTSDGGYIIAGYTGWYDEWLVKTDPDGDVEWNRTYGGVESNQFSSVIQTDDGGFAIAGGGWLVKTDGEGNLLWNHNYGGPSNDGVYSLVETWDRSYALAGWTESWGAGKSDF